jgi:hypothetical protein
MNDFAAHGCGGLVIRGDDGHVPEAGGDLLRGGWRMVGAGSELLATGGEAWGCAGGGATDRVAARQAYQVRLAARDLG